MTTKILRLITFTLLVLLLTACPNEVVEESSKSITSFYISESSIYGDINNNTFEITGIIEIVNIKKLSLQIEHTGVEISPASGSEQDFTKPVKYTVTAKDGSTKVYTVTLEKAQS